jgi:hypothetical protein
MIVMLDELMEIERTSPPRQRHQSLEGAKEEGYSEEVAQLDTLQEKTSCDSHGETVHGKSEGCEPYFKSSHCRFLVKLK